MTRAKSVDDYIDQHPEWGKALRRLRNVMTRTPLDESIKWGSPCYSMDGKNLVAIVAFSKHFALWFHQGALLDDPDGVLTNAQEGKTKALRHWRFTSEGEIEVARVRRYVLAAIENHRAGKEIKPDRDEPLVVPALLRAALTESPKIRDAFDGLRKGKQREYANYIAEAKREETRATRLEKILPMIEAGQGLNDKYRRT